MGRQSKAVQKREQIVWALYDCLAEKGAESVTVKDIAAGAGLPHGVIHYYFKSKDDIISALAQALQAKYISRLNDRLASLKPDKDRIEAALDFYVEELIFDRGLNRVFYNLVQMAFQREELSRSIQKMLQTYRESLAAIFEQEGMEAERSRILGTALMALGEGLALQWMVEPEAFEMDRVRLLVGQAVADHVSRG